jgi:transposase
VWAIEGSQGIDRHIANRLLAAGERVVDVPPKLSARARFATGQGRKTDATDAHSVALAGTHMRRLRPVVNNEQLAPLSGPGRPAPVARRGPHLHGRPVAPAAARAHPGRSEEESVRRQAMTLLATVRPRDAVGKARCRVAAGLIADLERDLPAIQGGRQGAQATGCRDREQADGVARHRTVRRSAAARGGR